MSPIKSSIKRFLNLVRFFCTIHLKCWWQTVQRFRLCSIPSKTIYKYLTMFYLLTNCKSFHQFLFKSLIYDYTHKRKNSRHKLAQQKYYKQNPQVQYQKFWMGCATDMWTSLYYTANRVVAVIFPSNVLYTRPEPLHCNGQWTIIIVIVITIIIVVIIYCMNTTECDLFNARIMYHIIVVSRKDNKEKKIV